MLELQHLCAGYGSRVVLHDVCVSLRPGTLLCLVGPNGCGKSTLLRATLRMLPVSEGRVILDGTDVATMSRGDLARRVAYLSQGRATPDMTVEEVVLHGRFPHLRYPRRYTARDRALAHAAMGRLELLPYAAQPLHALSGGMRQNVYLAMALAQDADYILLDEPTTYLDIAHQLQLMRVLRDLAKDGKGILAVMHDLPLAFDCCDEVAVMEGGRVMHQGNPCEVAASPMISSVFGVELVRNRETNQYGYRFE